VAHQLTTAIISAPGRLPGDHKKSKRMTSALLASDMRETGSKTGCPPATHEMLNNRLLPIGIRAKSEGRAITSFIRKAQIKVKKRLQTENTIIKSSYRNKQLKARMQYLLQQVYQNQWSR